jgi:uncharacterized protein
MSDTDDGRIVTIAPIANPGPLGLCSAALTIFVLSAANAKLYSGPQIVIGLAFFYGGLAQLLAGMWEFKTGNTFGATVFTSYGAFWMSVATILQFKLLSVSTGFSFFLLGWTIFTGIMFLATLRRNVALILLFGFLFVTLLLSTIGAFTGGSAGQLSGYVGFATAAIAWYMALSEILASMPSAFQLPVGMIK